MSDVPRDRFLQNLNVSFKFLVSNLLEKRLKLRAVDRNVRIDNRNPPEPCPTPTRKRDIFRRADFLHVENNVKEVILLPNDTFQSFAAKLVKNCKSNIEKCWAIYYWMSIVDYEDLEARSKLEQVSTDGPMSLALRKKEECVKLFSSLLECANIPVKIIDGYAKGASYIHGQVLEYSLGTWCAVFVENEWRLVDPAFGCFKLANHDSGYLHQVETSGSITKRKKKEGHLVSGLDETFFLPDPELFVRERCAKDSKWQLLPVEITKDDFEEMIYSRYNYRDADNYNILVPCSHPKGIVETDSEGQIKLFFTYNVRETKYTVSLFVMGHEYEVPDAVTNDGKRIPLREFLYDDVMGKGQFAVTMNPPMKAKYVLKISINGEDIFDYAVHCPKPKPKRYPLIGTYGVTLYAEKLAIDFSEVDSAEINVQNGEGYVPLVDKNNLIYETILMSADSQDSSEIHGRVVQFNSRGGRREFLILTRQTEVMALIINAALRNVVNLSFERIGAFVLDADEIAVNSEDVPNGLNVGRIDEVVQRSIQAEPLSLTERVNPVKMCRASMQWKINTDAKIETVFCWLDRKQEVRQDEYKSALFKKDENVWDFRMKFPQVGYYLLKLFSNNKLFYVCMLQSHDNPRTVRPFPKSATLGYEFSYPNDIFLEPGRKTPFHVKAPYPVKSIQFIDQNKNSADSLPVLTNDKVSNNWIGQINPGSEDRKLSLMAHLESGKTELLTQFQVLTKQVQNQLDQEAQPRTERWRETREKRLARKK